MRVMFLVRSLDVGGAQRQLVALARGLRRGGHEVSVAVFYGGGVFEEELRVDGIPIHDLARRSRWETVASLVRLVGLVRSERPDVLHAYMGLANFYSGILKPLLPSTKVVWGVRDALTDLRGYGALSVVSHRLERLVSPLADAVVANSHAARREAVRTGICGRKVMVIPNGIDCEAFRHDGPGRERLRREWRIGEGETLVGVVARLDPVKGHPTFLRAAAAVAAARPDVRFVCVGDGRPAYRQELARLASELGITERLTWAGERRVTSAVYSAFDLSVLPSNGGESFPNVIAESMACGTPCVVTESGDAPEVVADTGAVVPPGDPGSMARGILDLLERSRAADGALGARARSRVESEFSVEKLVSRTEEALRSLRPTGS